MPNMLRRTRAAAGRLPAVLRAGWRRHRPGVWALWAIGAVALLTVPLAIADPAVWFFVLDPELLALMVIAAVGAVRINLTMLTMRLRSHGRSAAVAPPPPEESAGPAQEC